MKRWAVLTVLLYAIALVVLTAPVFRIAFGGWATNGRGWHNALNTYSYLGYWIWLTVLVGGQILLLLVPVKIVERRLPARRPLKMPVMVTAFFLAGLGVAGLVSLACVIFRDDGLFAFTFLNPFALNQPDVTNANSGYGLLFGTGALTLAFWAIWAIIFRNVAKSDEPDALLKRAARWLLRGSILELLIAVPSHVIVRRREDCLCAGGHVLGNRHRHIHHVALFRPRRLFPVCRAISTVKAKDNQSAGIKQKDFSVWYALQFKRQAPKLNQSFSFDGGNATGHGRSHEMVLGDVHGAIESRHSRAPVQPALRTWAIRSARRRLVQPRRLRSPFLIAWFRLKLGDLGTMGRMLTVVDSQFPKNYSADSSA